jgi:hypothetical protein
MTSIQYNHQKLGFHMILSCQALNLTYGRLRFNQHDFFKCSC